MAASNGAMDRDSIHSLRSEMEGRVEVAMADADSQAGGWGVTDGDSQTNNSKPRGVLPSVVVEDTSEPETRMPSKVGNKDFEVRRLKDNTRQDLSRSLFGLSSGITWSPAHALALLSFPYPPTHPHALPHLSTLHSITR